MKLNKLDIKKCKECFKLITKGSKTGYCFKCYKRPQCSEKKKLKISKAVSKTLTGRQLSVNHRKNISKGLKRAYLLGIRTFNHSEKTKQKIRKTLKKLYNTPEMKKKISLRFKKMWKNKIHRKRMSKIISKNSKKYMSNYENLIRFITSPRKKTKDTKIELIMEDLLKDLKLYYKKQFVIPGFRFVYDFYLPKYNLLIECDGNYWHSSLIAKKRDRTKSTIAINEGYKIARFKGTTIKNKFNFMKYIIKKRIK